MRFTRHKDREHTWPQNDRLFAINRVAQLIILLNVHLLALHCGAGYTEKNLLFARQ